jgi:hypothetical protein
VFNRRQEISMPHIPKITGDALESLRHRIVPLMRFVDVPGEGLIPSYRLGRDATVGDLYRIKTDCGCHTFVMKLPVEPATGLREIARATMLSTFQCNFLPSEAEVLAQMPPAFADAIVAFEVLPDEVHHLEHDGLKTYRRAIAVFYAPE